MKREKGFIRDGGILIKGNCYACKHLEWVDGDVGDPSGFNCNDRDYKTIKAEEDHIDKLQIEKYLYRSKPCCELNNFGEY